jgi:hypothetical protein
MPRKPKTESGAYTCFVAMANCVVNNVKHMKVLFSR